ncbi:MAG: NAD-dependent epimerase/dehydratase family protein [Marinicaulis sp.]|nr:NAD-dependent epimerase/dehydratase family protein [Marinicaulis sp.]
MRFAVTGASGFIGRELLDILRQRNFEVAALIRNPDAFKGDQHLQIIAGDLDDPVALKMLCEGADFVINLAGVTHPKRADDYEKINVRGASNIAAAAKSAQAVLIHISSLSARQPSVSPYAMSKRQGEDAVADTGGSWVSLRLPAIYGPRDSATLPFFKTVAAGWAPAPNTNPPAKATLLHVSDAAAAIVAAALEAPPGAIYEVGDDTKDGRSWREISDTLGRALGISPRHLPVPKSMISVYHAILAAFERISGKGPSVRIGQVNEFFHPDWVARENLLSSTTAWRPAITLEAGFAQTIDWYRANGLL